jgi:4-amino-4-deoxy-L-arabinose transferase-like glycosyltransferase
MERAGHDPLTADRAPAQPAGEGTQPGGAAPGQTTAAGDRQLPDTGWRRLRTLHPAVGHLILLLCYLAAGVAVTWPRATYLAGRLPSSRDSASYVWGFWWMARQVSHLGNPWFTNHMAAPIGVSLGYHSLMALPGLIFTPVTLLFGPSASYNLLVILVPGLSSYAMYRAARLWLRSQTGAIAAGAAFGLSAMLSQEDWYHINIAVGALFLPVTLELAVRLRRSPGVRQALLLGIGLGAAVLTDSESAVLAAILTLCVLLPWVLRRPSLSRVWPAALAALVTAVVATPQLISMAQETARGGLAINPALLAVTDKLYGIGLPGMFAPSPRVADFGLTGLAQPFIHSRNNENLPMFGVTVTALALFGLVVAWRRRNTKWLALLWVACCALALGGSLWVGKHQYVPFAQNWNGVTVSPVMPYTWFVRIPGLSSFREADRLAILGLVPAALLAGAAVDWMRYHARPLIAVVVALGVLETGYSGNPRVGEMPTALPRLDAPIAADHSQSIVVDVPFGLRGGIPEAGGRFAAEALVLATADGHPRAIAYVSRLPQPTINGMYRQAFYGYLVHTQHYTPPASSAPRAPGAKLPLFDRMPASYTPLTAAQVAAGRRNAQRLNIGWVLLWYKNPALVQYLSQTGFRFGYRADGVSVYRPANR